MVKKAKTHCPSLMAYSDKLLDFLHQCKIHESIRKNSKKQRE